MSVVEVPLIHLGVYGFMDVNLIPLCTYALLPDEDRQSVVNELLLELATKETVIIASTIIKTGGFDGFRII
jgi:hypothetical protein